MPKDYLCAIMSHETEDIKHSERNTYAGILKYTGLFGGIQGFNVLLSILRNKCAALLIGATGIGLTDILNRTTDFIGSMSSLGISFSGTRKLSEEYATGDADKINTVVCTIRTWSLTTGIVGTILCLLASPLFSDIFGDASLTPAFITVSPIIALLAVYGGEAAIMKGTRRLKELAVVSAAGSLATLLITVAVYEFMGLRGVPPALLISTAAITTVMLFVGSRSQPWTRHIFASKFFAAGKPLLLLGVAYLAAGMAGTGAEMAVRAYINSAGSTNEVGLYAAGIILCVTYTRLIFVAMDADFFPRLSAAAQEPQARNLIVCRQIDVCVLLMVPMLLAFITFLPVIIRILYTAEFSPVIDMCVAAGGYLFIKAIVSPIEYLPLSRNDSSVYFTMELTYDILFIVLIITGYRLFGLKGVGWALTIAYAIDLIMILLVYKKLYDFALNKTTLKIILFQGVVLMPSILLFSFGHTVPAYVVGCLLFIVSTVYSVRCLNISWQNVKTFLSRKSRK